MADYFDHLETRSHDERESQQMNALSRQVAHAQQNAPTYGNWFKDVDASAVNNRDALARLPLTRKDELMDLQQQDLPFGGFVAAQAPDLNRVFVSPGPIYEPGCRRDDFWRFARALHAAGFRAGDLLHNCFAYHFTPAGAMVESGAHALECTVFPAGPGQLESQVEAISALRPAGYVGTPSFLKMILDKGDETSASMSSLKVALVSGEYLPPDLRAAMGARGINVLQCYATADLGLISYESDAREGMILDEEVVVEIVRPGTGDPVPEGQVGEVVVTTLSPEYPLIRFATGDLSAIMPGESPCGRTNRRIKGWMGRADQTTKVRGMFVRPSQVAKILEKFPQVVKGRLVIDRIDDVDHMLLHCEVDNVSDGFGDAVALAIREVCNLRGAALIVPVGSLPNDGKVIDDQRPVDS